jgi:preprotein translocase subunit YajC
LAIHRRAAAMTAWLAPGVLPVPGRMQQIQRKDTPVLGNMILAASASTSKSSGSLNILLIVVVLFGVLYFVMIRRQRNRQRKVQQQQREVAPGARVRTTAGMYATVVDVDGDDVTLEVAPGVEVRYIKRAIMQVLPDEDQTADQDYPADDEPGYAADDDSAADAGDEADDHEAAGDHEAADDHADEPVAQGGDEPAGQAGDESPNGSPTAPADEHRTQGSV